MGQPHSVDVGLFHQSQVPDHQFLGHDACPLWVVLVAVDAAYLGGFAVHEQLAVLDVDGTETHLHVHLFDNSVVVPPQLQHEGVERG